MKNTIVIVLSIFFSFNNSTAQSKAYVLQNSWSNTLSQHNPSPFFDNIFSFFHAKLKVKEITRSPLTNKANLKDEDLKELIVKHAKDNIGPSYYISITSDLSVPLLNFTRIIFFKTNYGHVINCVAALFKNGLQQING